MIQVLKITNSEKGCVKEVLKFGNPQKSVHHSDYSRKSNYFSVYNSKRYGKKLKDFLLDLIF